MAQIRCDVDRTIPKHVDESDNSSGNGESIKSSGGSDSLSLNLISGERSRDDSIPTDDSHISTDRHRYYIQEVTVTGQDLAPSHQEVTDNNNLDDQGEDEVVDSEVNPDASPNPHIHSWLRGLNNSSDGPFQVTRGTQYTAEDDPPSQHTRHDPQSQHRRQDKTGMASYSTPAGHTHNIITSNSIDKNFVNGVCLCLTLACMLYGVGSVIPRLNHLENQMMQSQVTRCQVQDTMKQREQNQDHKMTTPLPDHINQPMLDFNRSSYSVLWFLFCVISIVTVDVLYNFTGSGCMNLFPFQKENILSYYRYRYFDHRFVSLEEEINDLVMHGSCLKDVLGFLVRNVGAQESQFVKICDRMGKLEDGIEQTTEYAKEHDKFIESQIDIINGLENAQNATMADVQNDVKTLIQHKAELEKCLKQSGATHDRRIEDIESECKQMKAAILGLFMSLKPQIDKFVREYDKIHESVVALDVVPMMGLVWCLDQNKIIKDDTNEYCTKANLIENFPTFMVSQPKMKYEMRLAIMKCMAGTYRAEMIQAICSHCGMLKAVLDDIEGRNAICRAIESPDMGDEIFRCLSYMKHEFVIEFLPELVIESFWNRLNGENTFAFHLIYILLTVMKVKYVCYTRGRNVPSELREQLKIKTCRGLKRDDSDHVDECLEWLCEKYSPELSYCSALLLWRLLQSDDSWVEYMKEGNSLADLKKLVTDPTLGAETKQVIIQILGKCDILVSTDVCGSAMPLQRRKTNPLH